MALSDECYRIELCKLNETEAAFAPLCTNADVEGLSSNAQVASGHAIYRVPSFVQHAECDELMSAASELIRDTDPDLKVAKQRLPIIKLPQ
eukprot:3217220-Prymnesium_polylepis.1